MSKIQGKPFIELVVDTLGDLKTDFLDLVNGSDKTPEFRSLINASAKITDSDKGKVQYVVLETWSKTYTGYLIYNNTYCVLVAFSSNTQALTMLKIDVTKQTFTTVKEYLDINELRRLLQEANDHIVASEIDSGEAQQGEVLFADGQGGAEWGNMSDAITEDNVDEGSAVKIFGFNSEGNLVQDDMPEGIVVDDTIVEDSPNAVAGGAVYDALAEIGEDITGINAALEQKANVNGNYPTMTVGFADNITPYDESSGGEQDEPFSFQATGTGNGSQPDFATGSGALMKEKQGNSVVVNQIAKEFNSTNWTTNNANASFASGVATFTATADGGSLRQSGTKYINTHKYLIYAQIKLTTANSQCCLGAYDGLSLTKIAIPSKTGLQIVSGIYTATRNSNNSGQLQIRDDRASDWDAIEIYSIYLIDLTQWFNGDIPADLLSHPENFFRYYQGSLAYNEGTLVNANGRYIKCIGMNQWDEEWEIGSIDGSTGQNDNNVLTLIRSTNYIKVVPNKTYYANLNSYNARLFYYDTNKNFISYYDRVGNGTFEIPANASYLRFRLNIAYGTTYNNDITISIYYEDETRCLTYEPYQVLTNNDTGTEVLRSAGSVKDTKAPDGTITRRIGYVDLGDLEWFGSDGLFFSSSIADLVKKVEYTSDIATWILNAKYNNETSTNVYNNPSSYDKCIAINSSGLLMISDSSYTSASAFKTAMAGVKLHYGLAEPITEQGTPYSENLVIDDFGSMDFGGTNGVPQGASIFYPVDYKAFVDTLHKYTDGTPSKIALKSDLPTAPQTWAESLPGYDATKTQSLKNVNGTLTWVDD